MEKIDFVITWVDGSDPKWLAEKKKYENVILGSPKSIDANSVRVAVKCFLLLMHN